MEKILQVPFDLVVPKRTRPVNPNRAEADIDRAVERVYQIYGPDLSLFFKAVQTQQHVGRLEKSSETQHISTGAPILDRS